MNPEHTEQTKRLEKDLDTINGRLDRHLEVYAQNGKEIARLASEINALNAVMTTYIRRSDSDTKELKEKSKADDARLVTKDEFDTYKKMFWLVVSGVVAQGIALITTLI